MFPWGQLIFILQVIAFDAKKCSFFSFDLHGGEFTDFVTDIHDPISSDMLPDFPKNHGISLIKNKNEITIIS